MVIKKNFKFLGFSFLFLLLSIQIFAVGEEINSYEYLKLEISQEISFQVEKEPDSKIEYFHITSNFFPKSYDDSQYLNNFTSTNKNYKIIEKDSTYTIKYSFDDSTIKSTNVILNTFLVESIKSSPKIYQKVEYPLKSTSNFDEIFIKFENLIDTNSQIKKKASELAYGEDDVYVIAVKVADWIQKDINYDLSTVTENPNQKSSQVFISKSGVCKEITNLYVSMMRSLGIPARTVSGYAYTTSEEVVEYVGSNWGGHAWAEVLIGDTWVPFDLTYSQYGYVDATHLILAKNENLQENVVSLNASAYGIKLTSNSLKTENKFSIEEKKERIFDYGYKIEIDGIREISHESYGYIKITVENTKDYYKVVDLKISKVKEVEFLESEKDLIILMPKEKKDIYFRYKFNDLDEKFMYTIPFTIYNNDFKENFSILVRNSYQTLSYSDLPENKIEKKSISNNDLITNCYSEFSTPKNKYFCDIKNQNNHEINNINVCFGDDCDLISLLLNEEKRVEFEDLSFNQTITITYLNKSNTELIKVNKPKLDCRYDKYSNEIMLKCDIKNHIDNLYSVLNINNQTHFETNKNYFEKKVIFNEIYNELVVELEYENEIIDIYEVEIEFNQEDLPSKSIINFFSYIFNFFKNLFM